MPPAVYLQADWDRAKSLSPRSADKSQGAHDRHPGVPSPKPGVQGAQSQVYKPGVQGAPSQVYIYGSQVYTYASQVYMYASQVYKPGVQGAPSQVYTICKPGMQAREVRGLHPGGGPS
eukprot:5879566-Pyramimonas_sp.AAC.1